MVPVLVLVLVLASVTKHSKNYKLILRIGEGNIIHHQGTGDDGARDGDGGRRCAGAAEESLPNEGPW
jgi:hypothetical protein